MLANYRMAQPTQWAPAILDYMKKVKSSISTVVFFLAVRARIWGQYHS